MPVWNAIWMTGGHSIFSCRFGTRGGAAHRHKALLPNLAERRAATSCAACGVPLPQAAWTLTPGDSSCASH